MLESDCAVLLFSYRHYWHVCVDVCPCADKLSTAWGVAQLHLRDIQHHENFS